MISGGSAQGANDSLKNNRHILAKKKKLFNRKKTFLSAKREYAKEVGGIENINDLSENERNLIKNKIRKQQKKERSLWLFFMILILPLLAWGTYNLIASAINENSIKNIQINHTEEKFLKYIMYGDTWIEDEKWNPAIEMYQKAIQLAPNNFDAKYRLLLAYSYKCEKKRFDCDIGQALSDSLLHEFPNKQREIIVLDSIFKRNKIEPLILD